MKLEQIIAKVGELFRNGRPVFYAYTAQGEYIEHLSREWVIVELIKEQEQNQ